MTSVPTDDIFTRRVCLQLNGMDAVAVQRDITTECPDRPVGYVCQTMVEA